MGRCPPRGQVPGRKPSINHGLMNERKTVPHAIFDLNGRIFLQESAENDPAYGLRTYLFNSYCDISKVGVEHRVSHKVNPRLRVTESHGLPGGCI